jgi:hypothetical protein
MIFIGEGAMRRARLCGFDHAEVARISTMHDVSKPLRRGDGSNFRRGARSSAYVHKHVEVGRRDGLIATPRLATFSR